MVARSTHTILLSVLALALTMPTKERAGGGIEHAAEYCSANAAQWVAEVLEREKGVPAANWAGAVQPRVCSAADWKEVWPKDHEDWFADFDARHLSVPARLPSGDIEVQIPWRTAKGAMKAGGPAHYMQFLYLKDEAGAVRAVAKFESSDTVFPFVFPAAAVAGAAELTSYSVDVIHGVWKGSSIKL